MIFGVGTDLCEVERIAASHKRFGLRFVERILGPTELQIYQRRSERLAMRGLLFVATRFAAKEALSKALGLGMRWPMSWRNCELLPNAAGKPYWLLHEPLASWCKQRHLLLHASVTDTHQLAQAFVIAEQTPQNAQVCDSLG